MNPWISDSKSNTLFSELIWHMLLRASLSLCLCITWFLDLDDLVRVNRIGLYKEPISKCQVSPERRVLDLESEVQAFNTHWGNILLLEFFVFIWWGLWCQYSHYCQLLKTRSGVFIYNQFFQILILNFSTSRRKITCSFSDSYQCGYQDFSRTLAHWIRMNGNIDHFRAKAGFLPGYFSTIIWSALSLQNFVECTT